MSKYFVEDGRVFRADHYEEVSPAELVELQDRLRAEFKEIGSLLASVHPPTAAAPVADQPAAPVAPEVPAAPAAEVPAAPVAPASPEPVQFPATPAPVDGSAPSLA
jgi:hypothetical protein